MIVAGIVFAVLLLFFGIRNAFRSSDKEDRKWGGW